jgi:hypothetical protein
LHETEPENREASVSWPRQGKSLIDLFKSIHVLGKWPIDDFSEICFGSMHYVVSDQSCREVGNTS